MLILFLTAFNMFLSFSMLFPIFPAFVKHLGGEPVHVGTLISIQPLLQLLLAPFWGKLSDRYGRVIFIAVGMVGYSLSFLLTAVANSIPFLYFARIVGGILSASALPTILAYVSDTTEGKGRNVGMGIVGAGFGLGIVFGPFFGGLLGHVELRIAFLVASFISLANALLVSMLLREPERKVRRIGVKVVLKGRLLFFVLANAIITFAMTSMEGILGIMLKYRFDMDVLMIGITIGVAGISGALVQAFLRLLVEHFSERTLIILGLAIMSASMLSVIPVQNTKLFIPIMIMYGIGAGLVSPNLSAYFSKIVPEESIGAYMGMYQSGSALGRILGPSLGAYLYQINVFLPYALASSLLLLVLILILSWM